MAEVWSIAERSHIRWQIIPWRRCACRCCDKPVVPVIGLSRGRAVEQRRGSRNEEILAGGRVALVKHCQNDPPQSARGSLLVLLVHHCFCTFRAFFVYCRGGKRSYKITLALTLQLLFLSWWCRRGGWGVGGAMTRMSVDTPYLLQVQLYNDTALFSAFRLHFFLSVMLFLFHCCIEFPVFV